MSSPPAPALPRRRRFVTVVGGTLSLLLAASFVSAGTAQAAPGPAPESRTLQRIGAVHTDAVSTFIDDGDLVLASKADTPALATRYESDDIFFHVDDASKYDSWPAEAPAFVAPAGTSVWLAPQTQVAGQIWPGFSTESVPTETLVGDQTTLTLQDVDGPGDVELWQTGSFGATTRLWSSDEDIKSFTRGRVHLHANWAFTKPGTYRLTVRADATLRATDEAVSDTAVYTFVVGELPDAVDTTTSLTASATSLLDGDPVTLTSTVAPAGVEGAVEFRDGSTVLGHDPVDETGNAELTVPALAVGAHAITGVFRPTVDNHANTSVSAPVTVTVTDASGEPFAVRGVAQSYAPGSTLAARTVGVTLKEGQEIRWRLRYQGTTSTIIPPGRTTTYSQKVDANHDGAELQATLYDTVAKATVGETAWAPIAVEQVGGRPTVVPVGTAPDPLYPGDSADFEISGRALGEGETVVWGLATYGGLYPPAFYASSWAATYPNPNGSTLHLTSRANPSTAGRLASPLVATVMKDGLAIARSEFTFLTLGKRELNVSGARTLYREGGRVQLDATTYPAREGDDFTYTWTFSKRVGTTTTTQVWGTAQQAASALEGPTLNKAEHDGGSVTLTLFNHGVQAQTSAVLPIKVTDDLDTQILEFSSLADHYHQGDDVSLRLTADPEPLDGDSLEWQWKWPGGDWETMPGVEDDQWRATAEQGLDGVEIRAVLTWADSAREPLVSAVRTIHVDDHGGAARQKPTVTGTTAYNEGQTVALTRALPENGSTILTTHRWERKLQGAEEWTTVEGATGVDLSFPATASEDGAQYRVSILTPVGDVAYGPSPAVELSVADAPVTEPTVPAATTITAQRVTQIYGKAATLSVGVSPAATGTVRVTAGKRTISADLVQGRAKIRLPKKALAPGSRSVTVSYAGVPGSFASATRKVPVTVRKATPKIRVKASSSKVVRGRTATFVVTATASGVRPTGRVTVKVAGTTNTVRLNSKGKAVVRVKISKKASTGTRTVRVRYRGSAQVAKATAPTTRLTVTR